MALRIRVYDGSTKKVELDCNVRSLCEAVKDHNKGRKKPMPLVIGKSPESYQLSIEPIFVISFGGRS